ncbi:MAG TPA: PD-(D/E)XK nuclease family protein [Solirubrobacteraceae bacterium]|nr:PD-(D/E)XK nuclease family protein [Solirubrobacteraceae bacterium]
MPIALLTGPANAGKAHVVLEALRAHVARGEDPLLVVPTEADQARYRRELAEGGPVLGARCERFEGLLGEVLAQAGSMEAPLGPLARERVLARLSGARPRMAGEIARFVAGLETQRVTPARLRGALRAWGSVERPHGEQATLEQLCDVFERYQDTLARMRRADRELRVTRALDALRRKPALWDSRPVLLYGFDDLTELQLDVIETLGGMVGARVTVALAYEPGRVVFAGRAAAFQRLAPLADTHAELPARAEHYAPGSRQALHHLERSLLSDEPTRVDPGEAVRLLEGGTPRAELELVAGEVRALLDSGVPAHEIAIVHRAPETIAGLIGEVLSDFGVPHALQRSSRFAHTAIGRALLGLSRCALGEGDLGDLLAWLRAPGMLERPELADRLEAQARRQGALDGARARMLWEAENWPLDRIDRLREAGATGSSALIEALAAELQRLFCAPRGALAAVLEQDELDEARALVGARRALDEMRDLARSAPELAPDPEEIVDLLERLELAGGARSDGTGVAVVDPLSLRARRVRMVFACGMQEGVFPAPGSSHPLLGEEGRRSLAHASGLALPAEPDGLAAERYLLYALASRPEERLTLSWHTADEDGASLAPSLFIDDICDLFTGALRERASRRVAGASAWPGPGLPAGTIAAREDALAIPSDGSQAALIAPLRDRLVLAELHEHVLWSASSLESWAGCPVKWFVERHLRGAEIDPDPEPLARGGLAHAALKETLEHLRERTGSARLTPASVGLARRLLREALAELQADHPLSVAPERLPGARRRLAVDLERYLECAAEQATVEQTTPLEPKHLELEFGFEPDGSPPLELGEGVLLRGRIDRVDVGPGGEAIVYDYKGRSAPPAARWAADGSFQIALYMRAIEQLLGYTPVGGFYQPLAGRDIRARGALDGDAGLELDCVRTDRLAHKDVGELIDQCVAAALRAAGEARSGALQARPDTCAYRGGCAYPTICRCER